MRRTLAIACLVLLCFAAANAQGTLLHTQDQMNRTPHELNSHAGVEKWSSLEPVFANTRKLKPSVLIDPSVPEEQRNPFYPRVKVLPDGSYIMFYQGGQVASRIFCSFSDDLVNWTDRITIYTPYSVKVNGKKDVRRFTTIDAAILGNGAILSVVSFRASDGYRNGIGCGLMSSFSFDNGRSWTKPNIIYEGPNWEPYVLVLPDGTVQVYFTDCDPQTRNSGTSVIESTDGGWTFSPKKRIIRQYKYYEYGIKIYTDQMPVVRMLNDGKTLMAVEEARIEPEGPGSKSTYYLSVVYNDGKDWKDIGENAEGPKDRLTNVSHSNAGYLATLPSGEVVISSGVAGLHSLKIADHTGRKFNHRNWEDGWLQPFRDKGVWGSIEASSDGHHIISAMDAGDRGGVLIANSYLNHRIEAPVQQTSVDGDTKEWLGDEALFIGSDCPTQTVFRAAHDKDFLYILAERVDGAIDASSTVNISICPASAKKTKAGNAVTFTVGPDGLVKAGDYGKGDSGVKAVVRRGRTARGEKGYAAEIAVPLASLGGATELAFYASVQTGKTTDSFFGAKSSDPQTWQRIKLADKTIPAPFSASHSGEEQWSVLQPIYPQFSKIPNDFLLKGLPETAEEQKFSCYPRIKKMSDGRYLMLYMGGRFGSRIWYTTSDDLLSWAEPELLFTPHGTVIDGKRDVVRYVNPDAVVLPDGDILMVCSFRSNNNYHRGIGCGLMTRRSSDNGRTWSEAQQIYDGANWEPYLLALPDGRIQCYFTDAWPEYRNSGTSMLLSEDGGRSWSPKARVSRQYKYDYHGVGIYTDQMPSFRVLSDGHTLLGFMEARLEDKVPVLYSDKEAYSSHCKMSVVYNDSPDWKSLGADQAGPSRRHTDIMRGAAGYVSVFPSGEVAISCNIKNAFRIKLINSDGELPDGANWSTGWLKALPESGYWGGTEVDSPSTIIVAMHTGDGMQIGRYRLNHRIDAAEGAWSADSLYLCTRNGEEAFIRSRLDGTDLVLEATNGGDSPMEIFLSMGKDDPVSTLSAGPGRTEMRVPLTSLGAGKGDYICIFARLKGTPFTFAKRNDTDTWQRIRIR